MTAKFLEGADIVSAIVPVDLSTANNDGDWVNLKNYGRVLAVLFGAAGTAGQDPVFTLRQAQDNAGTGAKALNFTTIWSKVGTLTAVAGFTKVTQAAANTYTDLVSAEAQKIIAVEIRAEELDSEGGFTHVQLQIPDVGAAAQLGAAFYIMLDPRHQGDAPLASAQA
jgi:hypothetical protein